MMQQPKEGALVWITGLPGAGKTTLAKHLYTLTKDLVPTICIDGDVLREIMGNDLGYHDADRIANAYRIARLCKHLTDHHFFVLCSTVSLYKEIHEWNLLHQKNLLMVYLDVDLPVLIQRDQKDMYSGALNNGLQHVRGINQSYDIPEHPNFVIKNNGTLDEFYEIAPQIVTKAAKLMQIDPTNT